MQRIQTDADKSERNRAVYCGRCDSSLSSSVVDTRERGHMKYRRRHCNSCGFRWSTYEINELDFGLMVTREIEKRAKMAAPRIIRFLGKALTREVPALPPLGFPDGKQT